MTADSAIAFRDAEKQASLVLGGWKHDAPSFVERQPMAKSPAAVKRARKNMRRN